MGVNLTMKRRKSRNGLFSECKFLIKRREQLNCYTKYNIMKSTYPITTDEIDFLFIKEKRISSEICLDGTYLLDCCTDCV